MPVSRSSGYGLWQARTTLRTRFASASPALAKPKPTDFEKGEGWSSAVSRSWRDQG